MFGFGRKKQTAESLASFQRDFEEIHLGNTQPAVYQVQQLDMLDELTRLKFWEQSCITEMEKLGLRQTLSAAEFDTLLNHQRAEMELLWQHESAPWMAQQRTEAKKLKRQKVETDQVKQMQALIDQIAALQEQVKHSGVAARAIDFAQDHPFIAGFVGEAAGPAFLRKLTGQ